MPPSSGSSSPGRYLFQGSIIFVLYIFEMVWNISTSNSYCKFVYSVLKDACETILKRLKPFKEANPNGKWVDWVKAAYCGRVSLSATGFYRWGKLFYIKVQACFQIQIWYGIFQIFLKCSRFSFQIKNYSYSPFF
jgi:hypothetical protein